MTFAHSPIDSPEVGQQFADHVGRHWHVESLYPLGPAHTDVFVVKMQFNHPKTGGASYVMSSTEFRTLARQAHLRPLMR